MRDYRKERYKRFRASKRQNRKLSIRHSLALLDAEQRYQAMLNQYRAKPASDVDSDEARD